MRRMAARPRQTGRRHGAIALSRGAGCAAASALWRRWYRVEFTTIDDGLALGGVDLDTCRDSDGTLRPWALEVIERFASYAEVSPSGTGVKVFFTYTAFDLAVLRSHMRGSSHSKLFKRGGGEHPPAIELHLGNRYFTVTGAKLESAPDVFRHVPTDRLIWLLTAIGPHFADAGPTKGEKQPAGKSSRRRKSRDNSRSAIAFRTGVAMRQASNAYEEMCAALRSDPETAEWDGEKGPVESERQFRLIWEKAEVGTLDALIAEFNERYAVVNEAGKVVIYSRQEDLIQHRRYYDGIGFDNFRHLYLNSRAHSAPAAVRLARATGREVALTPADRYDNVTRVEGCQSGERRRLVSSRAVADRMLRAALAGVVVIGGALVWLGLGLGPAPTAPWRQMPATAAAGAAIYVLVTGLAWLAAGRPDGPERDLLALAGGIARRLRSWRLPGLSAARRARG
jgi:hypothetical protein